MNAQQDPNEAYMVKVRETAEIISDASFKKYSKMTGRQKTNAVNKCMDAARAMVAKMEEEAKEAYFTCAQDCGVFATYSDPDLTKHLKQRGLIPNTKTDNDA